MKKTIRTAAGDIDIDIPYGICCRCEHGHERSKYSLLYEGKYNHPWICDLNNEWKKSGDTCKEYEREVKE